MTAYTPDWAEARGAETLAAAAGRHLDPVALARSAGRRRRALSLARQPAGQACRDPDFRRPYGPCPPGRGGRDGVLHAVVASAGGVRVRVSRSRRQEARSGVAATGNKKEHLMATLVLSAAGAAVGGLFGPVGAALGRAAGAIAGYAIDQSLFGDKRTVKSGRLADLDIQTSSEGAAIPRVYGRMRIAGQVIWATHLEEEVSKENSSGGKGGSGGTTVKTYSYFANFAVGLCEGRIDRIGRVWADGQPFNMVSADYRIYNGSEVQDRDSLIEAKQGGERGAGLSRHGLYRLRAAAAGGFRQSHTAVLLRGHPRGRQAGETDTRRDDDPRRDRIRIFADLRQADRLARPQRPAHPPHRPRPDRLEGLDWRTQGALPESRPRRARLGVVRRRPPRQPLHAETRRHHPRPADHRHLAGGRPDPRHRAAGQPVQKQARLWRHPQRRDGGRRDPRPRRPGAEGHLHPLHHDGYRRRQRPDRSLWRSGAGRLSLAGDDHRVAGAGGVGIARQDEHSRRPDRQPSSERRCRGILRSPAIRWSIRGRTNGPFAG